MPARIHNQNPSVLFNSLEFLLFLPLVFVLYWFVCRGNLKAQNGLLLLASYVFYGWWSTGFMGLLMLSTLLDYLYGFRVASENRRLAKCYLWLSVINNLGILAVFKYYNFFALEFQKGLELLGLHANPVLLDIALPVGISFYTFHGMSYVFDIYRGQQKPVRNFVEYAVFVSFFPLLVAGPIERAGHLLPQVQSPRVFRYPQAVAGMRLMLWGFFKKVVLADALAVYADQVFAHPEWHAGRDLMFAALAFSFQIYCDFSGYSDIAMGSAKLFGFELLSNFRFPYFSRNVAEFWRRWHISLSSWFRDYVYIPLGGSRKGKWAAVRNTLIIFLLSGFWHGASRNFIAWGFLHACAFMPLLLLNRNRRYLSETVAEGKSLPAFKEWLQILSTFAFVTLAWVFFRAKDGTAMVYLKHMAADSLRHPLQYLEYSRFTEVLYYIVPLVLADWYLRRNERELRVPASPWLRYLLYYVLLGLCLHWAKGDSGFIYFQF